MEIGSSVMNYMSKNMKNIKTTTLPNVLDDTEKMIQTAEKKTNSSQPNMSFTATVNSASEQFSNMTGTANTIADTMKTGGNYLNGKLGSLAESYAEAAGLGPLLGLTSKLGDISKLVMSGKCSPDAAKIMAVNSDVDEIIDTINLDNETISTLIKKRHQEEDILNSVPSVAYEIISSLNNVISTLETATDPDEAMDQMMEELGDAFVSSMNAAPDIDPYEMTVDIMLSTLTEMVSPILATLESAGMPKLPIIGSIQDVVVSIKKLGQVSSKISNTLTPQMKAQLKEELKQKKDGKSFMTRLLNMPIWSKIKEILELVWKLLQNLWNVVQFYFLFALKELLEILKPVFETFGLAAGIMLNMLPKMIDFVVSLLTNQMRFVMKLGKAIVKKVEEVFAACTLPANYISKYDTIISALATEIVSCEIALEEKDQSVDLYRDTFSLRDAISVVNNFQQEYDKKKKYIAKAKESGESDFSPEELDTMEKNLENIKYFNEKALSAAREEYAIERKNSEDMLSAHTDKEIFEKRVKDKTSIINGWDRSYEEILKKQKENKNV